MAKRIGKIGVIGLATAALVQPLTAFASVPPIMGDRLVDGILSTLIYGIIGIAMAALSLRVVDAITPGNLNKQLTEEKNMALAIVVGCLCLGVCIIIAAAVAG